MQMYVCMYVCMWVAVDGEDAGGSERRAESRSPGARIVCFGSFVVTQPTLDISPPGTTSNATTYRAEGRLFKSRKTGVDCEQARAQNERLFSRRIGSKAVSWRSKQALSSRFVPSSAVP